MSVYEADAPNVVIGPGFLQRIRTGLNGIVRAMQYSRLMSVLVQMSDEQLDAIGIGRDDIPARAHESIYGTPLATRNEEA